MKPLTFRALKTPRLNLKPLKADFKLATMIAEICNKNKEHFKFVGMGNITPEEEFEFLLGAEKNWREKITPTYGIYLKKQYIGNISFVSFSLKHNYAELGYWLDENYCGKGYMTEAVKALENEFFSRGLNRMQISANVQNKASCAIAERLGYKKEGITRQARYNKYLNTYEDIVRYGKLKSEWQPD